MGSLQSIPRHLTQWRLARWIDSYYASNPRLAEAVQAADARSDSTGVGRGSSAALHDLIMTNKPATVLECGTGKSTYVIAAALAQIAERDPAFKPKIISLEDVPEWHSSAVASFPIDAYPFVDILLRPRRWIGCGPFRGTGYDGVPHLAYDLVLVDGPDHHDDSRQQTCNLTFLDLLTRADHRMVGVIDKRLSTLLAHRLALGVNKVGYSTYFRMSVTAPVTRQDMKIGPQTRLGDLGIFVSGADARPSLLQPR